jgi:cytochrome P450/NADPH-cytochrome P450 reductase
MLEVEISSGTLIARTKTPNGIPIAKALKPFGNGTRACLGKDFAMQQAKLAIASLFQRFNFKLADPRYELQHKQRIALQPDGFKILAESRQEDPDSRTTIESPSGPPPSQPPLQPSQPDLQPIYILWGGQGGTCETYAQTLSRWAPAYG